MREKKQNAAIIAANKVALETLVSRMNLQWPFDRQKQCKKEFKKELSDFLSIYDAERIQERAKGVILPEYSLTDAQISTLFYDYRMNSETRDILYTFMSTNNIPCYDIQFTADIDTLGHKTSGRSKVKYHTGDIIVVPEYGVAKVRSCTKNHISIQPYMAKPGCGVSIHYDDNVVFKFATDEDIANAAAIANRVIAGKYNQYLVGARNDARPSKFGVFEIVKFEWANEENQKFFLYSFITAKSNRNGYWNYIIHNPYNNNAEMSVPEQALHQACFAEIGKEPIGISNGISTMVQFLLCKEKAGK